MCAIAKSSGRGNGVLLRVCFHAAGALPAVAAVIKWLLMECLVGQIFAIFSDWLFVHLLHALVCSRRTDTQGRPPRALIWVKSLIADLAFPASIPFSCM